MISLIYEYFYRLDDDEVIRLIDNYFTYQGKIYRSVLQVVKKMYGPKQKIVPSDFISKEDEQKMLESKTFKRRLHYNYKISGCCWPIIWVALKLHLRRFHKECGDCNDTMVEDALRHPGHIVV